MSERAYFEGGPYDGQCRDLAELPPRLRIAAEGGQIHQYERARLTDPTAAFQQGITAAYHFHATEPGPYQG
ncbi:hypothetical protein [Saccharopolyspora sp. NPDC002376]